MKKLFRSINKRSQAGQSIIIIAIAMFTLAAFVGLVTDIALLFVRYSTLRRAVDSAAIAAAGQIREDSDYLNMVTAAYQFISLHGIGAEEVHDIFVETCETTPGDKELCVQGESDIPRKLVRVTAQIDSPTIFLGLVGMPTVTLEASSTGEAAVVDMALVLDTSESMSRETCYQGVGSSSVYPSGLCPDTLNHYISPGGDPYEGVDMSDHASRAFQPPPDMAGQVNTFSPGGGRNDQNWAYYCNDPNGDGYFDDLVCFPFKNVREAAANFIDKMDFVRGDRVAIVTFDSYALVRYPDCEYSTNPPYLGPFSPQGPCSGGSGYPMINDRGVAREVLLGDPNHTNPRRRGVGVALQQSPNSEFKSGEWTQCWFAYDQDMLDRLYGVDDYEGVGPDPRVWATCQNTNLGGGIEVANSVLVGGADGAWKNPTAVWVMVLLTDGSANSTTIYPQLETNYPYGFCPAYTIDAWRAAKQHNAANPGDPIPVPPPCRDASAFTRHVYEDDGEGGEYYYDADDYARDKADEAGLVETGNGIVIFTIGVGQELIAGDPSNQPWHGEALLRYIADVGDNGKRNGTGDPEHLVRPSGTIIVEDPDDDPTSNPCERRPEESLHGDLATLATDNPSCGNYFLTDPDNLEPVFAEIASRMFTRVTR